jgi:filamentous hemagglutinin
VRLIGLIATVLSAATAPAGPKPPLPVPCTSLSCGTSAQTFLQYGNAAAMPKGSTLTVTQYTGKAILNWADFNIAKGFTVNYVQPNATASILNNIWSADPSVIAGRLNANGQVYLFNQNGIVFDKGAQVDVGGLVAATLQLPNTLFENGILSGNTPGQPPPPAFVAPPNGAPGTIAVNPGATLTAADGGRIMLLGSAVTNQGSITTPDGQTILGAATKNVYLAASSDPSLRGLLIEVDGGGTTGTVTNAGQISAPRGNITLAGLVVNQKGMLSSTTSVGENGSIYLVAGDTSGAGGYYIPNPKQNGTPTAFGGLLPNNGGTLILAPGSVTEVLPDASDTATLTAPQQAAFIPSEIDLAARAVALTGNATIKGSGASVNVYAAGDPYSLVLDPKLPAADNGSIYLDKGSVIDVSGLSQVSVPVTQNLLQVTLETNDLQNDPLLRNGFLHGTTVTVNVNSPPTLFDIQPYANNIGANIEEVLTKAGTVQLNATGSVITRAGSTLNVSGGSIAYRSGYGPSTTNLLGGDGKVYNISTAPNTIQYVGIANSYSYTDPTWGTTTKGSGQSFYAGYTQGENAGVVQVLSPAVYLRGTMLAGTVNGINQRTPASLALGGTFELGCPNCTDLSKLPDYGVDGGVTFSNDLVDSLNGNIVFDGNVISATNIPSTSLISPAQLTKSGFNLIDVSSNGPVVLPVAVPLTLAAAGAFAVKSGRSIDIAANIDAPGGTVSLQTSGGTDGLSHPITVDAGAVIDVGGNWINDSPSVTLQPGTAPTVINGGTVSLSAAGDVVLAANARIDASGGGWINSSNQLTAGSAGNIALSANYLRAPSDPAGADNPYIGTVLFRTGATLQGGSLYAGGGGSLSVQSGSVTVGSTLANTPGELLLAPSFFDQGGFARYSITGQNDVIIGNLQDAGNHAPITIAPLQQTLVFTRDSLLLPTGSNLASFTRLETLPAPLRSPASVTFAGTASDVSGADVGDVTLARDASIVTDPGAAVTLAAAGYNGSVRDYGRIDAPAGTITLLVEDQPNGIQFGQDPGFLPNQQILLGPDAVLAAPAYAKINTLNPLGYREGSMLGGGTISLVANKGFVVTNPGSLINVSGSVGFFDIVNSGGVTPATVAGNGGTINIDAREGMVLQGSLLGQPATLNGAQVRGAGGGTLNIDLGYGYDYGVFNAANSTGSAQYPANPRVLTLVGLANGQPAEPFTNQLLSGSAFINEGTITSGGFDNVALLSSDTIALAGMVALHANASLTLDAPLLLGGKGTQAALSAAYVALGDYFNVPDYFSSPDPSPNAGAVLQPVSGPGTLSVTAQLIDIRGISGWSGFSTEGLSSSGDIRFVSGANLIESPPSVGVTNNTGFEGALNTSAALSLRGAQLYPTTATGFAINDAPMSGLSGSAEAPAVVTISAPASKVAAATPLSAGGSLSINATEITQAGVLRAPIGEISLNGVSILDGSGNVLTPGSVTLASGSLTSVSADGLILPYGATANATQWTYSPQSGVTDVLTAPPAKQISLTGASINVNSGAKGDLSGGGDLYAYEFIAGQGGSIDVLNPANLPAAAHPAGTTVYTYAILPSLGSSYAPTDPQYAQGQVTTGQSITLSSGIPGLAAGTYALLPARYAVLPGAYAIRVEQQNSGIAAGSSVEQASGAYVVAARFGTAGTSVLDSLTSTVLVASDAVVRTQSQYTNTYGNAYFTALAAANQPAGGQIALPQLPADAGQLALSASQSLTLNGTLNLAAGSFVSGTTSSGNPITQQGQGGDVAVSALNLAVVDSIANQAAAAPGTVQLDVHQLDKLDAETLILGASSNSSTAGELLTLGSTQTVELKNTTALVAPVIILAARDSVLVDPDARISSANSKGEPAPLAGTLLLPGGGALLRVSSGGAATLSVDPSTLPQNPTGTVTIGSAGNVQATGSLLLYGTNTTTLAPGAEISAPAVSLYSSLVSLGNVPTETAGLVLTPQLLGTLKGLTDLTLGSFSTINLYGTVQLGTAASNTSNLSSITLDAGGIGGYGSGEKTFQAGDITFTNSAAVAGTFANTPDGTGALQLIAAGNGNPASGQITLGSGNKTVSGVSALALHADGDILGQGVGTLTVASNSAVPLDLTAAAVVGSAASNQSIVTTGAVTLAPSTSGAKLTLPTPGLGAVLAIEGSSVAQNSRIDLPAGSVTLTATSGPLTLGKGSLTAAAGADQGFSVTDAAAAAGQIALSANAGSVAIDAGATVDVSGISSPGGTVSGGAGTLRVSAPLGTFTFAGSALKGSAPTGQNQGNFNLDVGRGLAGGGFTALDTLLAGSGFTGAINVRTRSDAAVAISNTVHAGSFELSADQGTIEVTSSGVINTSGGGAFSTDGGSIALWAGNGLTLSGGAQLLANAGAPGPMGANGAALTPHGGNIILGTAGGQIVIDGAGHRPTTISMRGGGGADTDGTLTLRAPRTADDTNVEITVQSAPDVVSRNPVIVEGFKTYAANDLGSVDAGCGTGGSCDIADLNGLLFTDAAVFMSSMSALPANLAALPKVQVRPGIEIDSPITPASNGDLTLDSSTAAWDLASWNAALGAPVNVTLRAAGNLVLEASLSDGFTNNGKSVANWTFGEPGSAAVSASYRLTAGADLSAAAPVAVAVQPAAASSLGAPPNSGNVIVTPGALIRTGSGDIDLAAGGDVLLGYSFNGYDANGNLEVLERDPQTSAIYTAGVPSLLTPAQAALFTPTNLSHHGGGTPAYPADGGNISVSAGDDIRSALSSQLITDWLWRRGSSTGTFAANTATSWWVMFNLFQQGIGTLGGGTLSLSAGRDIVNTSAVMPTTGRLAVASDATPVASDLVLTGGGYLNVQAGGSIISGVFENDWGNTSIRAGGTLTSSPNSTFGQQYPGLQSAAALPPPGTEIYPILVVGNGVFDVNAAGGIEIDGIANSTSLPLTLANQSAVANFRGGAAFYAYAPNANPSTLNLTSAGGAVTLSADPLINLAIVALSNNNIIYGTSTNPGYYLATLPSTVNVAALSSDVNFGDAALAQVTPNEVDLTLFPSATGNLSVLAAGAINDDGRAFSVQLSEVNPSLVPSVGAPTQVSTFGGLEGVPLPLVPLHQGDSQPISFVADAGNIATSQLTFPKAADVIAAGNIADLTYNGKNLSASDVTLIEAGGNLSYSTPTVPVTNELIQNNAGIDVGGPGHLEVLAGGSINLGDASGVLTSGNLGDSRLPSAGASMLIGAGFGNNADGSFRQPAYRGFIDAYLAPAATGAPSAYAAALVGYMQEFNPGNANLSYAAALRGFESLTPAQQLPLLAQVLDDELSATGLAHTLQGLSYDRGYNAINALFPAKDAQGNALAYTGDLNMFFSQLKTEQGGDIDLLVPGGSVVVGVPNPPANLNDVKGFTTPTGLSVPGTVNLGMLVLGPGAIEGFAEQSFEVNQSRILTLEGGDIILWASNGDIDAGKGAKSASGAPPPVIQTDANGNLFVNPSNAVSGSGIGQLLTVPGIKAGLVNLIAPKGAVNAGDAGIRVAGNLNIAAVQVIGAGNITVVGTSTGVPVSEAGALAGALSGANSIGDSSKNAVDQLAQDLSAAASYQQLTESLTPTFITVKMFCLGVECETN